VHATALARFRAPFGRVLGSPNGWRLIPTIFQDRRFWSITCGGAREKGVYVANPRTPSMRAALSENWWALALRGLLAVLFGFAALFLPLDTLEAVGRLFGAYAILDMTQHQVQERSLRSAACCLPTHLDLIVYVFSDTLSGTKANQVSVQVAARIQGPDHAGAFTGSRSCVFEIYRILRAS
jgi:hypothetical protein